MSILAPVARLLLTEHKRKPITGDVLTIGRQSVLLSAVAIDLMMSEFGMTPREGRFNEVDHETIGRDPAHLNVTDRSFFSTFSDAVLRAVDCSAYEGAALVHDLVLAKLTRNIDRDREDVQRIGEIVVRVIEKHFAQTPADDHAEDAIEQEVLDIARLESQERASARPIAAEQPHLREGGEVHEPVPTDGEGPELYGNGIELRMNQHPGG